MTKIIFIILGILLTAGGGYFFLSGKPIVQINLNLPPAAPAALPGAEIPTTPVVPGVEIPTTPVVLVSGTTITINDCKADPYILQVSEGTEITINNADSQSHTLFIAGPNKEVRLPAKGATKIVAQFSHGKNFTYNYLCDDQSLPKGGAIFVQP